MKHIAEKIMHSLHWIAIIVFAVAFFLVTLIHVIDWVGHTWIESQTMKALIGSGPQVAGPAPPSEPHLIKEAVAVLAHEETRNLFSRQESLRRDMVNEPDQSVKETANVKESARVAMDLKLTPR